ncbi:MAG: Gfo/Idh/MocA family oxidoreductase [Candidatus Latescibacteria bacterium]|jgi:predicted dehydrogenase|nr:Gfo/Idh/MocA family oxidoreductase [Candidatus Latescibacterota bacterium]MBT4138309.1 Gfo/Idh/MocA family oxidoreductase [Candidatus Latescibacterota bacterium]
MADKVRIGIIGAGGIFRSRHFPGLAKVDNAEVIAICNRSEDSGRKIADEFGLSPDLMTDPDALIARDDIDAVMIGTWPYKHCEFVLKALDAGKHAFVQARMAMNLHEAQLMYAKAQETGLVTQICPSPMGMKGDWFMRRLIGEGYLGDIYNVYTRSFSGGNSDPNDPLHWRQVSRYSGLNILNMGILVEVVHRWFGHMQTISAQAETFIKERSTEDGTGPVERPDSVSITGKMENGATAAFLFSAVARFGMDSQVEAYGSEGTLVYKLGSNTILGGKVGDDGLKEIPIPEDEAREWTVEKDFVDAIQGGSQGDTSFYDGLKYMEFTEAVARSVERGAVVNLPVVG